MSTPDDDRDRRGRSAALALGISSVLAVGLMSHHPTSHETPLNPLVHGGLIVLLAVFLLSFIELARRLGLERLRVQMGLIAYGLGVFWMSGAALINGFISPRLAHDQFGTYWTANQVLAEAGTLGMSAAIACWSTVLLGRDGAARLIAVLGIVIAVVTWNALVSGHLELNVHGMGAVLLSQAIWNGCIAGWLFRSDPRPER